MQETERLKLIADALTKVPELKQHKEAIIEFQNDISRKLKPTDQLKVNEEIIINGERAAEIVPAPKEAPKEVRLDGKYAINLVKLPHEYGGEYRLSVTRLLDGKTFMLDAAPDLLTEEQKIILKDSAFDVKHVNMKINATEHKGHIYNARMFSIEWP